MPISKFPLAILFAAFSPLLFAQLSVTSTGTPFVVGFDMAVPGVNPSPFTAAGYGPSPSAGQLDSDAWGVAGLSDGPIAFGGSGSTGDFARGTSSGGVTTGGIYAFDVAGGAGVNYALGVQPSGSDFNPGNHTFKILNGTGMTITSIEVSYDIHYYNDQDRSDLVTFSWDKDGMPPFTAEPTLDFATPVAASGSPAWVTVPTKMLTIPEMLLPGESLILKWDFVDNGGSGSRDEIALDDISIVFPPPGNPPPAISNIYPAPASPSSSDPVDLSAKVTDADGVDSVYARWGTTSGSLSGTLGMALAQNDTFTTAASIPPQPHGTTVYYLIVATDANGSPETDSSAEMSYTVFDVPDESDAWINEIHYDNAGADQDESIEIIIADTTAYDLTGFSLLLYNGGGGDVYGTLDVSDTLLTSSSLGFTVANYEAIGIQNDNDGIALVYLDTNVLQFLSYEGAFTATDGAAMGLLATDIVVSEVPAPPVGESLQLEGAGTEYSDFSWAGPQTSSPGTVNSGQLLRDPITYSFSGAWSVDPSGVSTEFDSIAILSGMANLSASTSIKSLTVAPGTSLDLAANTLSVQDTAYLFADATDYAQFVGEVDGITYWESYLESGSSRWFNVAVPIDAELGDLQFTGGGFLQTSGNASSTNVYYYDASAAGAGDPEGKWEGVTSMTEKADSVAYSIFLGPPFFGSLPTTISVAGKLLNGTQVFAITPQAVVPSSDGWGWNFVPNPYPSALDWDEVAANVANAGLSTVYWIFNDENAQWVAYNSASGSIPGSTGSGGGADALASRFIAPGQAFFVQSVSTAQSSVTFENDDRVLDENPVKQKVPGAAPNSIALWVRDIASGHADYQWIAFENGATDNWDDRRDGIKKFNDLQDFPALYFQAGGEDLIYNFISDSFVSRTLPLQFEYGKNATLSFTAAFDNLNPAWAVTLEDKLTNTFTDLRKGGYTFSHAPGGSASRFIIHLNQQGVGLPQRELKKPYAFYDGQNLVIEPGSYRGQEGRLEVCGIDGKVVWGEAVSGFQRVEINTVTWPPGIYLLHMWAGYQLISTEKVLRY